MTKKIFESLVSTEAHLRRQKIKKTAGKNRLFIPCPFLAGVPGYLLFIPCSNLLFFPHPSHLRLKNAGKKTYFISCPPKAFWLEAQYLEAIIYIIIVNLFSSISRTGGNSPREAFFPEGEARGEKCFPEGCFHL